MVIVKIEWLLDDYVFKSVGAVIQFILPFNTNS